MAQTRNSPGLILNPRTKVLRVSTQRQPGGFMLKVNGRDYHLVYPRKVWSAYHQELHQVLMDNLAFVLTLHLPFLYPQLTVVEYDTSFPLFEALYFKNFLYNLPLDAAMNAPAPYSATALIKTLFNLEYRFADYRVKLPKRSRRGLEDRAVIPFTFGKDSLLTYALCREIGVKPKLIFVNEAGDPVEGRHKKRLAEKFLGEFGEEVDFLRLEAGLLRDQGEGPFGWELVLTSYSLLLLPFAYQLKAKYILFGNEQSNNFYTYDKEGFKYYPSYEQSNFWMQNNAIITRMMSQYQVEVGSLIEPLNDLAILKVLHQRYPKIARYQMSCFSDKPEAIRKRWCGNCTKCTRLYILLLATGVDPQSVDYRDDLLSEKYRSFYALFGDGMALDSAYDTSRVGRDEQLLAFYLAYRKGVKGGLMREFKKEYLTEAESREKELRTKYFGISESTSLPSPLRRKVLRIFRETLKGEI